MPISLQAWFEETPVVTRTYLTLAFLTTTACSLDVRTPCRLRAAGAHAVPPARGRLVSPASRPPQLISPFTVYYNTRLIFREFQLWRLVTNFLFFGSLGARGRGGQRGPRREATGRWHAPADRRALSPRAGLDFLFHMFFLSRYCRLLEEGSFRGRSADFLYMLLFGAALLTCVAPFVHIQFLGSSLAFMMVYVWGRRNEQVTMSFLGLFVFTAPFLPWVLLAFSWVLGSSPVLDLLGIATGHTYYFLADVYPRMSGRQPLRTPALLRALFTEREGGPVVAARRVEGGGAAGGGQGQEEGAGGARRRGGGGLWEAQL